VWPGAGDHMGWMWLWWIGGLVALLLVVWVVARAAGTAGPARSEESPETVLKRRYARGEIDRDEYERRLNDLRR